MSMHEKTLKLVMNLDRSAIEAKLADVCKVAQTNDLPELGALFNGIEGMPRAQIETRVRNALKWLADKPQHQGIAAQLELIEINLPNLK